MISIVVNVLGICAAYGLFALARAVRAEDPQLAIVAAVMGCAAIAAAVVCTQ